MSGSIDPKSQYAVDLFARIYGTASFALDSASSLVHQGMTNLQTDQEDDFSEVALETARAEFAERTQRLYESFQAFQFPEGDLPRHYAFASVSDEQKVLAQADLDAASTNYLIDIDRLANSQTHRSHLLVRDETTEFAEGDYTFTLTVGEDEYSVSVGVNKSGLHPDTNYDVLSRVGRMISQSSDAIEASVIEWERPIYSALADGLTEKVVSLSLRNKDTGGGITFSLEDETGTIVDTLDLNHVVDAGQSSQYYVNSERMNGETNQVSLDSDKLHLTLLDQTVDPAEVVVQEGLDPVIENMVSLLGAFNAYAAWVDENREYFKDSVKISLLRDLDSLESDLKAIGLKMNENGKIQISDDFSAAFADDLETVRETISGETGLLKGIAGNLQKILDRGPDEYLKPAPERLINVLV